MKSKYKLPCHLIGKTIGIIGTYPGVGKSYVKNDWALKLRLQGYKVKNLGTTQKASVDKTVATESLDNKKDWITNGQHPKTHCFYFIDEAWMMSQERFDKIKENYPNSCFVLFSDPLQFDPVKNGKETATPITKLDYCINLATPYRFKDDELFEALSQIKAGIVPIDFMRKHSVKQSDPRNELMITYTNDKKDRFNNTIRQFAKNVIIKSYKRGWYIDEQRNKHFITNRNAVWRNGDLWEIIEIE